MFWANFRSFLLFFIVSRACVEAVILSFPQTTLEQGQPIVCNWELVSSDPSEFELWLIGADDSVPNTQSVTPNGRSSGSVTFDRSYTANLLGVYHVDGVYNSGGIGTTRPQVLTIVPPGQASPTTKTTSKTSSTHSQPSPTTVNNSPTQNPSTPSKSPGTTEGSSTSPTLGATQTGPVSNPVSNSTSTTATSTTATSSESPAGDTATYSWSNPTSLVSSATTPTGSSSSPDSTLIGAIAGSVAGILIIAIVIFLFLRRRNKANKTRPLISKEESFQSTSYLPSSSSSVPSSPPPPVPRIPPSTSTAPSTMSEPSVISSGTSNTRLVEELRWWRARYGSDWHGNEDGGGAPPTYPGSVPPVEELVRLEEEYAVLTGAPPPVNQRNLSHPARDGKSRTSWNRDRIPEHS